MVYWHRFLVPSDIMLFLSRIFWLWECPFIWKYRSTVHSFSTDLKFLPSIINRHKVYSDNRLELLVWYLVFQQFPKTAGLYLSLSFPILDLLKRQVMTAKLATGQRLSCLCNVALTIPSQVAFHFSSCFSKHFSTT